jgi:hypothetical protein
VERSREVGERRWRLKSMEKKKVYKKRIWEKENKSRLRKKQ